MARDLSYQNLPNNTAQITCTCGYESEPFVRGPFDPAEALVAFSVEHLKCLDNPPKTYYACAQEFNGKMRILGDLEEGPDGYKKCAEAAKGLAPQGRQMHVLKVKVAGTWEG